MATSVPIASLVQEISALKAETEQNIASKLQAEARLAQHRLRIAEQESEIRALKNALEPPTKPAPLIAPPVAPKRKHSVDTENVPDVQKAPKKTTITSLASSRSRPTTKTLKLCTADDTTEHILASDNQLIAARATYHDILEERRNDAKKERDVSTKALAATADEEIRATEDLDENAEILQALLHQLKALLGEDAYEKFLKSRPSAVKIKPALPANMKGVRGTGIRDYISHEDAVGKGEDSGAPTARAALNKKAKIRGGGGEEDRIPAASEIGSSM
ncbi:hypothetical protein DFH09DRAFT_1499034 [Mycena vulgaris]|nr:hypothetical protein DFH09DRAFT_1499034 [Mycena vulgaris]